MVALTSADPASLETVQACLLLAIALHGQNELRESAQYLTTAIDGALAGGLHMTDSGDPNRTGAVMAESARRTWWELWITETFMATLHPRTTYRCGDTVLTPCLPCEDSLYSEGSALLNNPTLAQYSARVFLEPEPEFSSYAYRIDAVRAMSRFLNASAIHSVSPNSIQAVDNAVASWLHHLPEAKSSAVRNDGHVDELMLQAQLFVHFTSILMHLPRSGMPLTGQASCATEVTPVFLTSQRCALKARSSANDILALAVLPMEDHSPLSICCLVFACVTQLSAAAASDESKAEYQDSVIMVMGVIKSVGKTWELAMCALRRLRPLVARIFHPEDPFSAGAYDSTTVTDRSEYDSGVDLSMPMDLNDFNWSKFFDDLQGQSLDLAS
ncbi:hypothetical protein LTR62_000887 [Meristemomyces frigidus]|uniref:Xylanolytic transcriptional activator regulatory domain-containing protein n=1 Tax=Meristemomyces frigidus TaxID=1508187 RepID=A0AAN7YGN3_9PEZI|nr:hypothetical protein LTR62_000887 [Meristemomyces frigidus]